MSVEELPQESASQEIGHHAVLAFERWHPRNWRVEPTQSDSDVGLDYTVQVVGERRYQFLFHAQVKGCGQRSQNGNNKRLSSQKEFYSQPLEISTLNYYARIDSPVMLVFADLVQNENPRECKVYYLWIDDELEELLQGQRNLDHLRKKTHTFRIPVTNILNDEVDVLPDFKARLEKRIVLDSLWGKVAEQAEVPLTAMKELTNRVSNRMVLDSILRESESPWIDAPAGSLAEGLHRTADYLRTNDAGLARKELEKIEKGLENATNHEKADYFYQCGRLNMLVGALDSAHENYGRAHTICSGIKKYRVVHLETRLNNNPDDKVICEEILVEIEHETEIEYVRLRSKTLAFMKNRDALKVLDNQVEKEVVVARALAYLLLGEYGNCKETCDYAIAKMRLEPRPALTIHIFRARALFNLGFGGSHPGANEVIPFAGLPSMDDTILRECWNDIVNAWEKGEELGYPSDLAYTIDMSAILGICFGEIERIYGRIRRFADTRPHWPEVQEALLNIALHLCDHETTAKQLANIAQTADTIICRILSEYGQKHRSRVVELTTQYIDLLTESRARNLDTVLLCAAECANELVRYKARDSILEKIKSLPNSKDMLAAYNFYERVSTSQLAKRDAVSELYSHFEAGSDNNQVLAQLLEHLDSAEKSDAERIVRVADVVQKQRRLTWNETLKVCEALGTIQEWGRVLEMTGAGLERFGAKPRLLGTRALALDATGDTPKALDVVEKAAGEDIYDPYVLHVCANIFARCGFADRAQNLLTKLLEKSDNDKEKTELFRLLFVLEMSIDHQSVRLLDYCQKYGQLNDRDDEAEEGMYLQLFFMATLTQKVKLTKEQRSGFHERLETYIQRFPQSVHLRAVHFEKDAPGEEILRQLEQVTGVDESVRARYSRDEQLLKTGQMIVPFSIRHTYLLNVCDLLHLWEISKVVGTDDRQYHLALEYGPYKYRPREVISGKIPLIDEISLFVLNDLGLLGSLFEVFERVAIAKSTITRLQNWSQHVISACSPIAGAVTQQLREHIRSIYQPSLCSREILNRTLADPNEYKDIIRNNDDLLLYSDDAATRYLVYEDGYIGNGMTSLDLVEMLRERGLISDLKAAQKIAALCSWNVGGVPVKYVDILRLIAEEFTEAEKAVEVIERLRTHDTFNNCIRYIWNFEKPYEECLGDIAGFVSLMASEEGGIEVTNSIIVGIWYQWYIKVVLKTQAERGKLPYLARSFWGISYRTISRVGDNGELTRVSARLWSVYKELVELIFPDDMTQAVYDESIELVGGFAVNTPESMRDDVYSFMKSGLVEGTQDSDLFRRSYEEGAIKRDMQRN